MKIQAFAKINWTLDITGVREDGYHYMDMLMQPVSVSDEILLRPSHTLTISSGGWPPVRADETNLAFRAALALKNASGYSEGATIHVEKNIPVGAGMGGGSTDAAAVLVGLNRLWQTGFSLQKLESIGLTIGADVPFFLRGGLTRTRGIGEDIDSSSSEHHFWLVVIQPCAGLSTARVFSLWKEMPALRRPETEKALAALENGDLDLLCASIENVLQPVSVSLRPEIESACEALASEGALVSKMTGSGSAVFGVFRAHSAAERAFRMLSERYKTIFLCHTQQDSLRFDED